MLPYVLCLVNTPPSTCLNLYGRSFWEHLVKTKMRLDNIASSSVSAQCWISKVTGFVNLQGAEIQKTGLRRSEPSGSWNCPARLTLMLILHSVVPGERLSLETWSLSPYPFQWNEPRSVETVNSTSPATSTPWIEPGKTGVKVNVHFTSCLSLLILLHCLPTKLLFSEWTYFPGWPRQPSDDRLQLSTIVHDC